MRNKAPLAMIEQLIMLLVFSLAAAVCLRGFVWADQTSKRNALRDRAVVQAQNAAEILKSTEGDCEQAAAYGGGVWDGETWTLQADEDASFYVQVTLTDNSQALLGTAEATAYTADGEELFVLPFAWQEASDHA
jgi:type II secretory pathway pseudopilin PulG